MHASARSRRATIRASAPHFDAGPLAADGGRFSCANWRLRPAGQPGTSIEYSSFVAAADVNGDGHVDIVAGGNTQIAGDNVNGVTVLLGDGTGEFTQVLYLFDPSDMRPMSGVALGDTNQDGIPDIIAIVPGVLSTGLGVGNGTFYAPESSPADTQGGEIATGDFNGDGKLDVVYTSQDFSLDGASPPSVVAIALGNGNGTFREPAIAYEVGVDSGGIAVADLDGDGKLDVVVTSLLQGPSVMLGNGDGTLRYGAPVPTFLPYLALGVAIRDLNHDGIPDLALAAQGANAVEVLLGQGDGTFQPPAVYNTDVAPYAIAVADFDGDGNLDIVTANVEANSVSVFLGRGDGSFDIEVPFAAGTNPSSVAVGDFNGDGVPDLVVGDSMNSVSVLLGTCQP